MTISKEFFIMPMIGVGTRQDPIRSKYTTRQAGILRMGSISYGSQRIALTMIEAEQSVLDTIAADAEVDRIGSEFDLDKPAKASRTARLGTIAVTLKVPEPRTDGTERRSLRDLAKKFMSAQRNNQLEEDESALMEINGQWKSNPIYIGGVKI